MKSSSLPKSTSTKGISERFTALACSGHQNERHKESRELRSDEMRTPLRRASSMAALATRASPDPARRKSHGVQPLAPSSANKSWNNYVPGFIGMRRWPAVEHPTAASVRSRAR